MSDHSQEHEGHIASYGMYVVVWLALVALTGVTIGISYLDLKNIPIMAALMIATVKVTLVVLYFMHVRFDRIIVPYMFLVFLGTFAIYIGLTMTDYGFR